MPKRTIKLAANWIHTLEVISDVQDDLPSPGSFDQLDEVVELFVDHHRTGPGAAVSGQLEIDSRREGVALGRGDIEEMVSLVCAGRAQSEVVVGPPIQSGFLGSAPVLIEAGVGEVTALGGLDVRERDAVACDAPPVDDVLMMGHIDAVSLALLQGRPPVRHPKEPPDRDGSSDEGDGADPDQGPASTWPRERWRATSLRDGRSRHRFLSCHQCRLLGCRRRWLTDRAIVRASIERG